MVVVGKFFGSGVVSFRFVWRVEVLGRQGWGRGRIFIASHRVWDDRECMEIRDFFGSGSYRREEFVCIGGVGCWGDVAEEDISRR